MKPSGANRAGRPAAARPIAAKPVTSRPNAPKTVTAPVVQARVNSHRTPVARANVVASHSKSSVAPAKIATSNKPTGILAAPKVSRGAVKPAPTATAPARGNSNTTKKNASATTARAHGTAAHQPAAPAPLDLAVGGSSIAAVGVPVRTTAVSAAPPDSIAQVEAPSGPAPPPLSLEPAAVGASPQAAEPPSSSESSSASSVQPNQQSQPSFVDAFDVEQKEGIDEDDEDICIGNGGSEADQKFDTIVGALEDLLLEDEFTVAQREFLDKHLDEFEDTEENKLCYMSVFQDWIKLIEGSVEQFLTKRIDGFNMEEFLTEFSERGEAEVSGDVFDTLASMGDFMTFKELVLARKQEVRKQGPMYGATVATSQSPRRAPAEYKGAR